MRAILVDPMARTVTEVQLESGKYEDIKKALFPDGPQGYIEAVDLGSNHHMYVDEEGLLKPWEEQSFFQFTATKQYIAGRGLILCGTEDGDEIDARVPLGMVKTAVRFVEPQEVHVPTPTFTNVNDDGTTETTRIVPEEEWTFDNQPR